MALLDKVTPPDPLMAIAWTSALHQAISDADIVKTFRRDTGLTWEPSGHPVEAAVDRATGADASFILRFAEWFNANIWGDINLPAFSADGGHVRSFEGGV